MKTTLLLVVCLGLPAFCGEAPVKPPRPPEGLFVKANDEIPPAVERKTDAEIEEAKTEKAIGRLNAKLKKLYAGQRSLLAAYETTSKRLMHVEGNHGITNQTTLAEDRVTRAAMQGIQDEMDANTAKIHDTEDDLKVANGEALPERELWRVQPERGHFASPKFKVQDNAVQLSWHGDKILSVTIYSSSGTLIEATSDMHSTRIMTEPGTYYVEIESVRSFWINCNRLAK